MNASSGWGDLVSLVDHLARTGAVTTLPFDAAADPRATLDDLAADKVEDFLRRAQAQRGYALGPGTPLEQTLTHLNLLEGGQPTHAALLLFGRQPQRFLPTSEVKCLHFHGTEVRKPIPSYQVYKGTVFELVDQAVDVVLSKIAAAVGTRAASNQAPLTYEIPRDAVAEAIVNAVAHRDYASNASVQVMLFADRLEIWNPGALPPSLTPARLFRPHASIPRNPLLAEPLFLARYIERAGTGTLDMVALCVAAGLKTPEFRQDGGQFVQTLWRPIPKVTPQVTPQVTGQVTDVTGQAEAQGANLTTQATEQDKPLAPEFLAQISEALGIPTAQVTAQATAQAAKVLIAADTDAGKTRDKLRWAVDITHREHFRKAYLEPLVAAGWLERTIADKPTSPNQRYRLTAKGRAWLSQRTGGAAP